MNAGDIKLRFNVLTSGLVIFSILSIAFGIFAIIGFVFSVDTKNDMKDHRYCLFMSNDGIFDDGGGGDAGGYGQGWIEVNLHTNKVKYKILFSGIGTPTNLAINGPVNSTSQLVASQFFPDSGSIDILEADDDGFYTGEKHISEEQAKAIIKNPAIYYIILKTNDYPNGSIGQRLGGECPPN